MATDGAGDAGIIIKMVSMEGIIVKLTWLSAIGGFLVVIASVAGRGMDQMKNTQPVAVAKR